MPEKPRILNRRSIAHSRLFHVEELELCFSNGVRTCYERLRPPGVGAVLVIPMQDEDTVLLIREYAAGTDRYELGLPKGHVEVDEDILDAANREMMEEVGYGAKRLTYLHAWTIAPGYLGHTTHIVLAQELYAKRLKGDEPEPIEVIPWRLSELSTLIKRDDCTEARTIAALFLAREIINK